MTTTSTPYPVLGTAEAAKLLRIPVPNVTRLRKAGKLPPLAADTPATPVWHREDLERHRDGRPSREKVPRLALLSTGQAAAALGVDKSQIGRWRRAGTFPDPAPVAGGQLAAGPLWERAAITAFRRQRELRGAA